MSSSLNDDIIRKALEGKTSTDDALSVRDEPLMSGAIPAPALHDLGDLLGASADVRFLGDVDDYALFAQSAPATAPRRHRRLVQQVQVFGARVVAEGTEGTLNNGSSLFNTNLADMTYLTGTFGLANLRLVVSNVANISSASAVVGTYEITNVVGGDLTLDRIYSSVLGTLNDVYWQVVIAQPVELLPWPGRDETASRVYLARKPNSWPVRISSVSMDSSSATATITAEGRLNVVAEHTDAQTFTAGDWAVYNSAFYYVESVAFTPGGTNVEDVVLSPFFGVELPRAQDGVPSAVQKAFTVGELAGAPFVPRAEFFGDSVFEAEGGDILDTIRVKSLISPQMVGQGVAASLALFSGTSGTPGYGLTLYPATAGGLADLSNPITDLEGLTIDPAGAGDDQIFVDWPQGVLRLSTPIPAAGGQLNPNNYVDADGAPRLFAVFAALDGQTLPKVAQGVEGFSTDPSLNAFRGHRKVRLEVGERGLEASLPSTSAADIYHDTPPQERLLVESGSTFAGGQGVRLESLSRDRTSARAVRTDVALGLADTELRRAGTVIRPTLSGTNLYDVRMSEGLKQTLSSNDGIWPVVVLDTNDGIEITANGVDFSFTIAPGAAPSAADLAGDLLAAYTAAETALGLTPQRFDSEAITDATGDRVRIQATGELYFGLGNAHVALGFPSNAVVDAIQVVQEWGYANTPQRQLSFDTTSQGIETDVTDVRISGALSGRAVPYESSLRGASQVSNLAYPKFVVSGGVSSLASATQVDVTEVVVKHPLLAISGGSVFATGVASSLDFTGEAAGTYFFYFDVTTLEVETIVSTDGAFDETFEGGSNVGIPLAQVDWDGASIAVSELHDLRRFSSAVLDTTAVTVGAQGMFKTLRAACSYVGLLNPEDVDNNPDPLGAFTIRLLEDVTLSGASEDEVFIPSNIKLDLAGHDLTITNYTGGAGTGPFVLGRSVDLPNANDEGAQNVEICNGRFILNNFGTQALSTAPDIFRSFGAGSDDVTLRDLDVFAQSLGVPEQVATFLSVDTRAVFERVRFVSVFSQSLVTFGVSGDNRMVIRDSLLQGGSDTGPTTNLFDFSGADGRFSMNNTRVFISFNSRLVGDGAAGTSIVNMNVDMSDCTIDGGTSSIVQGISTLIAPLRVRARGCKFTYDVSNSIVDGNFGLDGAIMSFTDCEFIDDQLAGSALNAFLLGDRCELTLQGCTGNNLSISGGSTSSRTVLRISDCKFVAGLTEEQIAQGVIAGVGESCRITLDAGRMFLDNSTIEGRIRAFQDSNGSQLQISNCQLRGATGLAEVVDVEGGFVRITGTQLTNAVAGATATIRIRESTDGGFADEPQAVITGCQIVHTVGAGIYVDGLMDGVNITGCYFRGAGGGTAAVETNNTGVGTNANLSITGGQMEGYPFSSPTSDAVILAAFTNNVQVANVLVRPASGGTQFNEGASTGDIFIETSVHWIT